MKDKISLEVKEERNRTRDKRICRKYNRNGEKEGFLKYRGIKRKKNGEKEKKRKENRNKREEKEKGKEGRRCLVAKEHIEADDASISLVEVLH